MDTGVVTEHLVGLIARQVEDHSLVVWYDPDNAYTDVASGLVLHKTTVVQYDGSFFKLRNEIDHLMNDLQPPRLVVYVPEDRANTHHALIELEAAGVVVQPGQQPPTRNTRLAVIARNALRPILGEETAADVERQADAGKLTLAELNTLADLSKGVIGLVFGSGNPQEVALAFLASDQYDANIEQKEAIPELRTMFQGTFEVELPEGVPLTELRDRLTRHVLMTDLISGLGDAIPPSLAGLQVATALVSVNACVELARNWRLRRDVRDSYVTVSKKVEEEFSLAKLDFDPDKIIEVETFLAVERALLHHIEDSLLESPNDALFVLAESRLSRFWSDVTPALQAHWALIVSVAEVLLEAERIAKALKKAPATIPTLVREYAEGDTPWCLLDTCHRNMESRWYNFEPEPGERNASLEKLILKAEQRYTEVGSELAKHFVTQFSKAKHPIKGVLRQTDIFNTQVKSKLEKGKTAYVWVDALRFEMARQLCEVLKDDFDLSVQPAIATIPTITEIGMAALLPRANQSAKVVSVGGGKLGVEIEGAVLKDRKDRIAFLKAHAEVPVFDAKLDNLLPKPSKKIRDGIRDAQLVLITSQEIDELCEKDNVAQARRQMDGVLNDLRRGFRVLADLGVKTIILAADHGHLFAEEISEDMKIEAPGGDTADLHRRVWVGVGGTSEPSYLRTSLSSLGVESDLDIATPWTFACFKAKGGGKTYFHGGLSPQELIVPVVMMTPTAEALMGPPTGIDWTVAAGAEKLTTRFFSVQVTGIGTGLFELEPPKIRVEIRAKGKAISKPVSASYGFENATGDVQLKVAEENSKKIEPNTITVMVSEEPSQKTVSIVLLDSTSGAVLATLDKIEVAISI